MNLSQIRYFVALCDGLNFTQAARRCHVSQPSLTSAIKALEGELKGPLFYRSPTTLTPLGEKVKPYFLRALASIEKAKRLAVRPTRNRHEVRVAGPVAGGTVRASSVTDASAAS